MHIAVNIHTGQLFDWVFTNKTVTSPSLHYPESDVIRDILVEGCKVVEGHFYAYAIFSPAREIAARRTMQKHRAS